MAKTETNVSTLKINKGTYEKIQQNLSSIGENEIIITSDKNIPIPEVADSGKVVKVNASGEYELSSTLYHHSIAFSYAVDGGLNRFLSFSLISNRATAYNTTDLTNYIHASGTQFNCGGFLIGDGSVRIPLYLTWDDSFNGLCAYAISATATVSSGAVLAVKYSVTFFDSGLTDVVTAL